MTRELSDPDATVGGMGDKQIVSPPPPQLVNVLTNCGMFDEQATNALRSQSLKLSLGDDDV